MTNPLHPGETLFEDEIWWVMVLDAHHPHQSQLAERFYLADGSPEGCKQMLADVQQGPFLPIMALNLHQMKDVLQRFSQQAQEGKVIERGESRMEAWLVWVDPGPLQQVQEVWTYTQDPHEAEREALQRWPHGSALLRASLSSLQTARGRMEHIQQGHFAAVWLDLRTPPRHLSAVELLDRKLLEEPQSN